MLRVQPDQNEPGGLKAEGRERAECCALGGERKSHLPKPDPSLPACVFTLDLWFF